MDWLSACSALIAPPLCAACRRPVAPSAEPLCRACRAQLPWLLGPRCERCALPGACGRRCAMARGPVERSWAPMAHEGPAREIVHALKFRGALGLADLMAAQIVAGAPAGLLASGVQLVPVPTPPARRRARGFDHAGRIAAAISARTGLPVVACLRRTGRAPRQARAAGRAMRLQTGRIHLESTGKVPEHAVLVDDVHTTGATLRACGAMLRMNGASRVWAVAYARALR
jgi:predicted amidophosphoribosyltransferase